MLRMSPPLLRWGSSRPLGTEARSTGRGGIEDVVRIEREHRALAKVTETLLRHPQLGAPVAVGVHDLIGLARVTVSLGRIGNEVSGGPGSRGRLAVEEKMPEAAIGTLASTAEDVGVSIAVDLGHVGDEHARGRIGIAEDRRVRLDAVRITLGAADQHDPVRVRVLHGRERVVLAVTRQAEGRQENRRFHRR